ncbi:CapA family protein [Mesorhizobium sp. M0622]|uniref:CapA family protein n=1 Tax=unclassified Mesorhizobium TaxID=325217 RepID=UPI00333C3D70
MVQIPLLGPINIYDGVPQFRTAHAMKAAFKELGYTSTRFGDLLRVAKGGRHCYLFEGETSFMSRLGSRILKDKVLTSRILKEHGLEVAEQHVFVSDQLEAARPLVARMGSVVVKPADGRKGRGVTVGVTPETLDAAWGLASVGSSKGILIESFFSNAVEARYLVIDGQCVAVIEKVIAHVVGDGEQNVAALIDEKNARRARNSHLSEYPIQVDAARRNFLSGQGMTLEDVPSKGRIVPLAAKSGWLLGGETRNITDSVHPEMRRIAERATQIAPGLDVIGLDVMAYDHTTAPNPGSYIIIEANNRPGLGLYVYPAHGDAIDVCRLIAAFCDRQLFLKAHPPTDMLTADRPRPSAARAEEPALVVSPDLDLPFHRLEVSSSQPPTIMFGGDTSLGDGYLSDRWPETRARLSKVPDSFFDALRPMIANRAVLVLNLETVLAVSPPDIFGGQKKFLSWEDPVRTLSVLRRLGVDAVTLANNHSMDFGQEPALAMRDTLSSSGIHSIGMGPDLAAATTPLLIDLGVAQVIVFSAFEYRRDYDQNFKFYAGPHTPGVAGFGEGFSHFLPDQVRLYRAAFPEAMIVFQPHWGGKNYRWATQEMFALAKEAMRAGVDLVIGHGAHCLQQVEFCKEGGLVCSLGNFVYNAPGRYLKESGFPYSLIARLHLGVGEAELRLYPVSCDNRVTDFRTRPVNAMQAALVLSELRRRATLPDQFDHQIKLKKDDFGWWYLQNQVPLSPRFALRR